MDLDTLTDTRPLDPTLMLAPALPDAPDGPPPVAAPDPLAPFAGWLATYANPATRRSYAHALAEFLAYARATYLVGAPGELTEGMLAGWCGAMRSVRRLAEATVRRRQSAVRGALVWLRREREATRLVEVEREQWVCIARLQAQIVAYHQVVAGLHAAIQASAPGAVVCGCSFTQECHRADCPLQQAVRLLAQAA